MESHSFLSLSWTASPGLKVQAGGRVDRRMKDESYGGQSDPSSMTIQSYDYSSVRLHLSIDRLEQEIEPGGKR